MHRYQPQWPDDPTKWVPQTPVGLTFRDAIDLEHFAALDVALTRCSWPDLWHLDDTGRVCCCSRGSSLDSVRRYAKSPDHLLDCRLTDTGKPCPDNWLMIEPRPAWKEDCVEVTEGDARAFRQLRKALRGFDINLLDVVIFHEDHRWWSLHELTCGTTKWEFDPPPIRGIDPRTNRPGGATRSRL